MNLAPKRKSTELEHLENPIHHEAKRTCLSHEQNDISKTGEEIDVSKKEEVIDSLKNNVEADFSKKQEEIDTLKKQEKTDYVEKHEENFISKNPKSSNSRKRRIEAFLSKKLAERDISKNPLKIDMKENDVSKKQEENSDLEKHEKIVVSRKPESSNHSKKHEETVVSRKPKSCNSLKKNKKTDVSKKHKEIDISKSNVEIGVEENDVSKTHKVKKLEEIDVSKKAKENDNLKNLEKIDISKNHKETDVLKKHKKFSVLKTREGIDTLKKSAASKLETLCARMDGKRLKKYLKTHITDMNKLREELPKALKLAKDPAKLVLDSVGRYFLQPSKTYHNGHHHGNVVSRLASVMILECFVMISSDISKEEKAYAAESADKWKQRMVKEGGARRMEEADARGLLLLISGFGIPDHDFKIVDIMDLIMASNVKGISVALRCSNILIPKIPEVIDMMVKNNLEIEAADTAYTFSLEDKCQPLIILTVFLRKKIRDIQNGSPSQMLEAMKQQLYDLKSVKQCLEFHKVDPSNVLPDFKIDEKIRHLEKEITNMNLAPKRKSTEPEHLENPIHHEAKRPCFSHEENDVSKMNEEIDVSKKDEVIDILVDHEKISKEYELTDILMNNEEINTSANHEELETLNSDEETDISKKLAERHILKNSLKIDMKENDVSKKHKNNDTLKKSADSELETLCARMYAMRMKNYLITHITDMNKLREELPKALKLATDPAKLVLDSIGRFFLQPSKTYHSRNHHEQVVSRLVSVMILECFVLISSDGIEISKEDKANAEESAVRWKQRMVKEGGVRHMEEADARGLLLLISGFRIPDRDFKIVDITDLIMASNVRGISAALRRSIILIPKIPEVIDIMVKNNLEIEAADTAYTFGLEDKCQPLIILTVFLRKKIRDIQNGSPFQMVKAMKQQLYDLKSVKECLEFHKVEPSNVLPDFKINEKIRHLEKEITNMNLTPKRKSTEPEHLENPIRHEAKRPCISHENMPRGQNPIVHYPMNPYTRPAESHSNYIHYDRGLAQSYGTHVYGGIITNQMARPANVQPYGWQGDPRYINNHMGQPYLSQSQSYVSQPYVMSPPESNPGFPARRAPAPGLYSFADRL